MRTTSLPLSKRIAEASKGFTFPESEYKWSGGKFNPLHHGYKVIKHQKKYFEDEYPAYTCGELMELLPDKIGENLFFVFWKYKGSFSVGYETGDDIRAVKHTHKSESIEEALGEMLEYLLLNGYWKK